MVDGEHAFATSGGTAWRRRQRRLRAFRRFVLWHSKMKVAATTAQFSSTAVEPIAPRVVGSLLPVEEFTGPVHDHVHQEQFAVGEMSENMVEIPVVQEQEIVQAIPEVVDSLPPAEEFTRPVYDHVHQELFAAGEMTENLVEIPAMLEQVVVQAFLRLLILFLLLKSVLGPGTIKFIMHTLLQSLLPPSSSRCQMTRVVSFQLGCGRLRSGSPCRRSGCSGTPWSR